MCQSGEDVTALCSSRAQCVGWVSAAANGTQGTEQRHGRSAPGSATAFHRLGIHDMPRRSWLQSNMPQQRYELVLPCPHARMPASLRLQSARRSAQPLPCSCPCLALWQPGAQQCATDGPSNHRQPSPALTHDPSARLRLPRCPQSFQERQPSHGSPSSSPGGQPRAGGGGAPAAAVGAGTPDARFSLPLICPAGCRVGRSSPCCRVGLARPHQLGP